jgi:hypothetical protein
LDVLVVTDNFTKMAHAFLCPNQSAKAVALQLWNNIFCVYGLPRRIHSDQGENFESKLIAELLSAAGVQKSTHLLTIRWGMGESKGSVKRWET